MANKKLFKSSTPGRTPTPANAVNEAGGRAFAFTEKHALAQYVATGTLNDVYYSTGQDQLDAVIALCGKIDPAFIAKAAVYSRESGVMKDMPALLCAYLSTREQVSKDLLKKIFLRVINNGRMLRNFVQIIRSGKVGRKSLGTVPKRLIQRWFATKTDDAVFRMSTGNDPSMADVIKLSRPKPETATRRALYGYLLGHDITAKHPDGTKEKGKDLLLPGLVAEYEAFKEAKLRDPKAKLVLPKVPWEMLEGLSLSEADWKELAKQASWTQTRMNLNTFERHGVFKDKAMVEFIAAKLRDPEQIAKAKPFPYQLFAAFKHAEGTVPVAISNALQDAVDHATKNVPMVQGNVVVCPDTSGSMSSPITGHRTGATTKMCCVDIAALVASVFLKRNEETKVLPFDTSVHHVKLNPRDSIMTNASKLARHGGGTNCSAPLRELNQERAKVDLVVFVSDNESWVDSRQTGYYRNTTGTLAEWEAIKVRNPKAKMVCIDIQPNGTAQAPERPDILNIGGFSDSIFEQVRQFVEGTLTPDHWVGIIEAIDLDPPVKAEASAVTEEVSEKQDE